MKTARAAQFRLNQPIRVISLPTSQVISFTAEGAGVRHTATACRQKDGGMQRKWEEKERKREKGSEVDGW